MIGEISPLRSLRTQALCAIISVQSRRHQASIKPENLSSLVTEQFPTIVSQKTANHWYRVIALLEDELARNEARPPLVLFCPALSPMSCNVFL